MNIRLWWQLKRDGMSDNQYNELDGVARQLKLTDVHLSREAKDAIAEQIGFKPVHTHTRTMALAGALGVLLLTVTSAAQFTHRGSPLYSLKRGTQNVRAIVQPSYKQELDQERAQEEQQIEQPTSPTDSTKSSDDSQQSHETRPESERRRHRRTDSQQSQSETQQSTQSNESGTSGTSGSVFDSNSGTQSSGSSSGTSYGGSSWWYSGHDTGEN